MRSPRGRAPLGSLQGTPVRIARNSPSSKIRVVARLRPALPGEQRHSCVFIRRDQITGAADTLEIRDEKSGRSEFFQLDLCYGELQSVQHLFMMELEPILHVLFRGCNATVFAYGATGSGKTHTMQGGAEEDGLIALAVKSILSLANALEAIVEVSYYEVYMDRCYDLLEPDSAEICILEGFDGRIKLRYLSQVRVTTLQEFQATFARGCAQRKVGETGLNNTSSRSHAVVSVSVTTGDIDNIDGMAVGKLNLIDLAGNEDNRRSGNDGVRLAESGHINQSLFALSNVINALNTNEPRVPYRDSKLTRILQDSLGGTSCSLMISCLNPVSYPEAIHTLKLAAKSRQIVNRFVPVIEETVQVDMEAKLKAWKESKGRTCVKSPANFFSPWLKKSFATPSSSRELRKSRLASELDTSFPTSGKIEFIARRVLNLEASDRKENETCHQHGASCCTLESPSRKALSPLPPSLINQSLASPVSSCGNEAEARDVCTPLQKFTIAGQNVQDTLVKEYIRVLNKGSRDELLALKGIGEKRAESILQLREIDKSPIKELQDLQKIGLSEKHACNLFNGSVARQLCLKQTRLF